MAAFVKGSPLSIDLVLKTLKKLKDTTVVNFISVAQHYALTAAIWIGRLDHQRQFHSLLLCPGFDLRLAFHQDEKGNCPLMSLAMLTAEHTTQPPGRRKLDQQLGTPATCEVLYKNCRRLFKELSDRIDHQELSGLFCRLSESLSDRIDDSPARVPRAPLAVLPGHGVGVARAWPEGHDVADIRVRGLEAQRDDGVPPQEPLSGCRPPGRPRPHGIVARCRKPGAVLRRRGGLYANKGVREGPARG